MFIILSAIVTVCVQLFSFSPKHILKCFWALGCSSEIEAKVAHEKANLFDIVSIVPEFKTLLLWSKMFFQNLSHKSLWKTSQRRRVGLCNILQRYDDDIFSYQIIV